MGVGWLNFVRLSFCLPNLRVPHTQKRINEWMSEQCQTEKNKTKSTKFGKMSYFLNNHSNSLESIIATN